MMTSRMISTMVVAVAAAAVLAHATTLAGDFILDDRILIVDNAALRSAADVPRYFARGMWPESAIGTPDTALYRPFVLLAFFHVYKAAGLLPLAFHVVNIGLHAANSILVLLLLRRLAGTSDGAAIVGALVFAVHPVHVVPREGARDRAEERAGAHRDRERPRAATRLRAGGPVVRSGLGRGPQPMGGALQSGARPRVPRP